MTRNFILISILFLLIILMVLFVKYLDIVTTHNISGDNNHISGETTFGINDSSINETKTIIFYISDFQSGWLENIQVKLVDLFISKKMSVVIGPIPLGMKKSTLLDYLNEWDDNPKIEIAQHGYDHRTCLKGKSYSEQRDFIENGRKLMKSLGIDTKTYVAPFASVDETTIKVLENLNYNAIVDATNLPYESKKLLIIDDGVPVCKDGLIGKYCKIRDIGDITSEIDKKVSKYGFALVFFEMHDISDGYVIDEENFSQLSMLLDHMKNNGYNFFTTYEYRRYLGE